MEESPIRVLLIASSLRVVGGQSIQADRLLKAFREVPGLQVTFLPSDQEVPGWAAGLMRVPYLRTLLNGLFYLPRMLSRVLRADVLHIFTPGMWAYTMWTIPAVCAARLFGKKTIVHYHDGRAELHLNRFRTAKPTLAMADRVVVPSGFLVEVFRRYGIVSEAIYNIIDATQLRYRARRKLRPVFLTNRGLETLYNVPCLLRAFARIQKRHPEASLTIAHDGPCRPALEQMAAELGLRQVRFAGAVSQETMAALYDEAEIYMMSPNFDCMPGSLVECFAAGLPIITTNVGGIPYIAEHDKTALMVDPDDDARIAEWAFRLLDDEALVVRLTAAGREELTRYSAERTREQWTALYREVSGRAAVPKGLVTG